MIFCDRCNVWFHGECVGITAKRSKTMDEWFCTWCSLSKKAEEVMHKNCLAIIRNEISQSLQGAKTCDDQLLLGNELKTQVQMLEEENKQKANSLELLTDEFKSSVQSKEQEILSLKNHVQKLEEGNKHIQQKANSLELLTDELKSSVQSKEQEILSLKNHVQKLEEENKHIQQKANSLELLTEELKSSVQSKEREILSLKQRLGNVGNPHQDNGEISVKTHKKSRLSLSQQKKK